MSQATPSGVPGDPARDSLPVPDPLIQDTAPTTDQRDIALRETEPPDDADPEQIEKHIERTRDELGDTVEALVAKFDVRSQVRETQARARNRAEDLADRARALAQEHGAKMAAGGVAAVAAVAGLVAWRRAINRT